MNNVITIVCGLPRSGTSVMMKMLHHGGMDVFCSNHQAYETSFQFDLPGQSEWMQQCRGRAVKILDIQKYRPPRTENYRFIHMVRDSHDQAKSIRQFVTLTTGQTWEDREFRRMQRSLKRDREKIREMLPRYKAGIMEVKFSQLVTQPDLVAQRVSAFCGGLNAAAMAAIVIIRDPSPLGGTIELLQMRKS